MSVHRKNSPSLMNAIANGVQVRLDERVCFSQKVTEETINTARALGIPRQIIEKWAVDRVSRLNQETKKLQELKALLEAC